MNIFHVAINIPRNTYDGKVHYPAERYTREKHNPNREKSQ